MSQRLTLAVETGSFVIPEEGRIALFAARQDHDLSALPQERVVIEQPQRVEYAALAARGFEVVADLEPAQDVACAVVFVTRAKALSRLLIARAVAQSSGPVLIDGAKTDGIDSLFKELKKRTSPSAAISKAHGKAFWIDGGIDLSDWHEEPRQLEEGFVTLPGVFSADGVDPASKLLAEVLPEKLGTRVADLGAGWGYLSAAVLRNEKVKQLALIEADHRALDCAGRNITDARAEFHWADGRDWGVKSSFDTVVMNPPFHSGRSAEPSLGQAFIANAQRLLVPSGHLWMVANRHLPYEAELEGRFAVVEEVAGDNRFKVIHAQRPRLRR